MKAGAGKLLERLTDSRFKKELEQRIFNSSEEWDNDLAVSDVCFSVDEADVEWLLQDDLCMFGTDALYVLGLMTMTHPRAIGTFPRILGRYVREKQLLILEEAVRKMTGFPACRSKEREGA